MMTVIRDARDIIYIDCLQNGKTINGEYDDNLLDLINEVLNKKLLLSAKRKVFLYQDNAMMHRSVVL